MESKATVTKTQTEMEMEEFLKNNAEVVYKKSSSKIGSRIEEKMDNERIVINGGFTKVKHFYLQII
jgi:hypothetical protein